MKVLFVLAALGLAPAVIAGVRLAGCPECVCCGCCETGSCGCSACTCELCLDGCPIPGPQAGRADGSGSGCSSR